jgi:hypothetical protein
VGKTGGKTDENEKAAIPCRMRLSRFYLAETQSAPIASNRV